MRNSFPHLRILTIFLILTFGLLPHGLVSAQDATTVSVSAPSQVSSGEQFTVEILVEPETAIAGMQFDLAFDPSLVTVDSVAEGDLLSQDGATTYFSSGAIDNVAGTIRGAAGAITTPGEVVSTPGTFATLTLTAGTQDGTSSLTLSGVVVGDIGGQPVLVSLASSQVTINQSSSEGGGGGGSSGGGGYVPPVSPVSPQDETAPEISDVVVSEITTSSADIAWTTDEESTSQIEYWASTSNYSPLDEMLITHHVVHLTNLTSGTIYYFRITSADEANNLTVSDEYTFTTLGIPATFTVSELDITPDEVDIGEEVTVSVLVGNSGDTADSYEVVLRIDGTIEDTKQVVDLAGGTSLKVTFTTARNAAGVFVVDVNGITTSSFTVEDVLNSEPEISLFSVTPSYDTETDNLVFTRVAYQVNNLNESMENVKLTLKVSLDGEPLEDVSLSSSNQMGPDGTIGSLDYIPLQGWRSGTYTFRAELYSGDEFFASTVEERLEVTAEPAVTIRWAVLGVIIGSTLVIILVMTLIVLYRRRHMLRA